jgi:hypothetical protein
VNDDALFDRVFVVTVPACVVRAATEKTAPIIRGAPVGERMPAHMVRGFAVHSNDAWARVKLPSGVIGYIWTGFGTWENAV